MLFHKKLDIPLDRLVKSTDHLYRMPLGKDSTVCSATASDPKFLLQDDIYEILSELGPLVGLLFEQPPMRQKDNIHVDIDKISCQPFWPCFNLILEGQGTLRWFDPKGPGDIRKAGGNLYQAWHPVDYGTILEEWNDSKVALVRTDIPHNAFNFDKELRLSFSVRWKQRYTWEETVQWFDSVFMPYIKKSTGL
jgi:hypothetical protein